MAFFRGPNVVRDGLLLYVDAANKKSYISGSASWKDLSNNSNNGTLTNGPSYNVTNGGSIVFDGTNDYVSITSNASLQFTNTQPYTIAAWIYWTETALDYNTVFCYGTSSPPYTGYYIVLDSGAGTAGSFFFDYFDGIYFKSIQGNANQIPLNSWAYVCGTCLDNNDTNLRFYVNGKLASYSIRPSGVPPSSINYSGLIPAIGNRGTSAFQPFQGRIATVSIYNRSLSASEVLQNYNATKTRFGL